MSFVWPPNGNFAYVVPSNSVNIFDTLEISYTSTWNALNFTLFCQIGDVSSDYGVWQAPGNPMTASGTYRLSSIFTAGFDIVKFPTKCAFRITEYGNSDVYNAGQFFEVVSDPGTSTTYLPTSTATSSTSSTSSTQTSGGTATTTSPATSQATGHSSASLSSSATATPSSSASSATTVNPVAQQNELSTAAKAGIGVGAAIAVLVIAALCFFLVTLRRRKKRTASGRSTNSEKEAPFYNDSGNHGPAQFYDFDRRPQPNLAELPNQQKTPGPRELE